MLLSPHYTAVFHETVVLAVTSSETGPVHSVIVSLLGLPQLPQVTRCFHALGIFLQCFQGFQGRINSTTRLTLRIQSWLVHSLCHSRGALPGCSSMPLLPRGQ